MAQLCLKKLGKMFGEMRRVYAKRSSLVFLLAASESLKAERRPLKHSLSPGLYFRFSLVYWNLVNQSVLPQEALGDKICLFPVHPGLMCNPFITSNSSLSESGRRKHGS